MLAYTTLLQLGASIMYLVVTRYMPDSTPFKETLTVGQRRVLHASKRRRGMIFAVSLAMSAAILCATRPLGRLRHSS